MAENEDIVALPTENPEQLGDELQTAYDIVVVQIEDIIADGKVDLNDIGNMYVIFKAVMEAVDAVGVTSEWTGQEKSDEAKKLIKHVAHDLHEKGILNDEIYNVIMMGIDNWGTVMFALTVAADKGKVLFQHVKNGIHRACVRCKNRQQEKAAQARSLSRGRSAMRARNNACKDCACACHN